MEVLSGYRFPAEANAEQRDELFRKLKDPAALQILGKQRTIHFLLDAAMRFAKHPEEGVKTLELAQQAKTLGAQLVTTEKDAVRLPPSFRQKVLALPVRLRFEEQTGLIDRLARL